jgi:GT2 family glycosyltransferase
MTVSFVIPNWNRRDLLAAVVASIRAQTRAALEVVVVDNGSTDGSAQAARATGAKVLELDRNRGFSYAVNRGLEAARGEAVAVVNNDVEFRPDWTEKLTTAIERNGAWFAIGKLLNYAHRERIDGVGDAICRGGTAWRLGHGRPDGPLFDRPRKTFFPSATAMLARREFFERAGNFEEAFFAYLEDVDLGLRAALLGLEGVYVPEAVAYHRASSTLGAWTPETVKWITRNQLLLLAKYYPAPMAVRFWRAVVAAQALWGWLAASRRCKLAYIRGLAGGLAGGRAIRRSGTPWRANGNRIAEILVRSEGELAFLQETGGWDDYWRWYFRLAPQEAPP